MSAIRDLLTALRGRPGVDAAIVVGRDGLVIDDASGQDVDREHIAARVPALLAAGDAVGDAADRGALVTLVAEHERGGLSIYSALSRDVALLVLLDPSADAGPLLQELRRERARLASLV
jgi:predicted regulator of Ras-like GTPase activity (Roadblock/LC7/MglB family)